MALPLPFDTQGFPVVNAIVQGGGIIIPAVDLEADLQSKPAPDPSAIDSAVPAHLQLDPDHALRTRARVLTDEGSFAGNFPGASLYRALTGGANITMTAASTAVTGVGTLFTTELRVGDYMEITAQHSDAVPVLAQVQSIESNLALTLRTAWAGVTATGAAQVCDWYVFCTANAGDAIAVAAGAATLTLGVTNGSRAFLARRLGPGGRKGCAPIHSRFVLSLDQNRVNQICMVGLSSDLGALAALTQLALAAHAGGDPANQFTTVNARNYAGGLLSVSSMQCPGVNIFSNVNQIDVLQSEDQVQYFINRQLGLTALAGEPEVWVPDPYQEMYLLIQFENTGVPAGATVLSLYEAFSKSADVLDVRPTQADPAKLHATVHSGDYYTSGTPRVPTNIADNLVHEITDAAGRGMQLNKHYTVMQIGGADIQVYVDTGAPAVATVRRSPFHLFNGIPWEFSPPVQGLRLWVVKAVDGTADADLYVAATDGGAGA